MKYISIWVIDICCIAAFCGAGVDGSVAASNAGTVSAMATTKKAGTEVVIIGTIHAQHLKTPAFSPEVLRAIVLALKPQAILIELPLDEMGKDGRPVGREFNSPEGWASDQAASCLKIPQIPFDRPDRSQYYDRTRYFQRQVNVNSFFQKWFETTAKQHPNDLDLEFVRFALEIGGLQAFFWERPPEFINSDIFDKLMHLKHVTAPPLLLAILKKSPDFTPTIAEDMKFLDDEWTERNSIMAQNIEKAAQQFMGGRLVVLTGAEHRYILHRLLATKQEILLKEYWELVRANLATIPPSPERKSWETSRKKLLAESPAVCRKYWEAVIQGNWEAAAKVYPARGAGHIKQEYLKSHPVAIVRIGQTDMPGPGDGTIHPVTPCRIKYKSGRVLEIKMGTGWRNGQCIVMATLGNWREVNRENMSP